MILLALAATAALWSPPADAPKPVADLIVFEYLADHICRGEDGDESGKACSIRSRLDARINRAGWCYSGNEPIAARRRWSRCHR